MRVKRDKREKEGRAGGSRGGGKTGKERGRKKRFGRKRRKEGGGAVFSRVKEGGLTSGRLYPEYPPRCFAQWGLSLSLSLPPSSLIPNARGPRVDVIFAAGEG